RPYSYPYMTTSLSKYLNQEIRGPVKNLRLLHKTFRRGHIPDDLHDPCNPIHRPEFLLGDGQRVEECEPGRFDPLLDRQITSQLTGKDQLSLSHGKNAGQKQELSGPDSRNVGRQRFRRERQLYTQFLESTFVRHPRTRLLPLPLTIHKSRFTPYALPRPERIEKTLPDRKLLP